LNLEPKSARAGGQDLIGKPFLTFEITVKALTLVLRRRLHPENEVESQNQPASVAPRLPAWDNSPSLGPTSPSHKSAPVTKSLEVFQFFSALETPGQERASAFFRQASSHLRALEEQLKGVSATSANDVRQEILGDLYLAIHSIACEAERARLTFILRLICALEGLLKKLHEDPVRATAASLATAASAMALLCELCDNAIEADLSAAPIRILVVDDDPIALRAITGALQLAFGRPEKAGNGEDALELTAEHAFDVIFLDIHMPGMSGLETCSKIHETVPNRHTPIVFVSGHYDQEIQDEIIRCDGSGSVSKPVLSIEITVLALTLVMRSRLLQSASCKQ